MNKAKTILSPQNARVKELVRLREGNYRRREQRFLLEGYREIERAMIKNARIEELFVCREFLKNKEADALIARAEAEDAQIFEVADKAFLKASYRENPDGLIAIAPMWGLELDRVVLGTNPLILIIEGVEKPGNLGTLLRSADGAGADAVIITDPVIDVFNPNVIRASQGAIFQQMIAVAEQKELCEWLEQNDFSVYATSPEGAVDFWEVDMLKPTAILMGREHEGLSKSWLKREDIQPIKIPMKGLSDSLNVSASAAIVLYEAVRQRAVAANGKRSKAPFPKK